MQHLYFVFFILLGHVVYGKYSESNITCQNETNETNETGLGNSSLDLEIENTQKIIDLYANKLEILKRIRENNILLGINSPIISEEIIDKYAMLEPEESYGRRNKPTYDRSSQLSNIGSSIPHSNYYDINANLPSQVHQRRIIRINEKIVFFRFILMKTMSRQTESNNKLGVLIMSNEGNIKLFDIKGRERLNISHPNNDIIALDTSPNIEDMFYAYVTKSGILGIQSIDCVRKDSRESVSMNNTIEGNKQLKKATTNPPKANKKKGQSMKDKKKSGEKATTEEQYDQLFQYYQYKEVGKKEIKIYDVVKNYTRLTEMEFNIDPKEYKIIGLITYMLQGIKYALLVDNTGHILVFTKELKLRNRIRINIHNLRDISKYSIYLAFAGDKSVVLLRMGDGSSHPIYCEGTTEDIVGIAFDQVSPTSYLYASLFNGDILVYDTKNAYAKNEPQPCKILGKLHIETKNHIAPSVKTLKGAIVGQNWEGNLHFYNNSDIQNIFDLNPKPSVLSPQLPKDLVQEWSRNYETDNKSGGNVRSVVNGEFQPKIVDIRSPGNEIFFLTRLPNSSNILILYESHIRTYKSSGGFFDIFNFKMPIIIFVILAVIGFQYFKRKNKGDSGQRNKFKRGKHGAGIGDKNYSEQEIEDITRSLGKLMKKSGNIGGSLKNLKQGGGIGNMGGGGRKNFSKGGGLHGIPESTREYDEID